MIQSLPDILSHVLLITGFVFVMMLLIEYLNVLTRGHLSRRAASSKAGKYLFAALMGVIPGCLGAFVIVALYAHRLTSAGALVTVMVATSGDEAFVMLSMIPREALLLMGVLFVVGIGAGMLTDMLLKSRWLSVHRIDDQGCTHEEPCEGFQVHGNESENLLPRRGLLTRWKSHAADRTILSIILVSWIMALAAGYAGPGEWNFVRFSLILVSATALFIVATVPGHFLHEHLWNHVARKHLPGIFLWTLGALLVVHVLTEQLDLQALIMQNSWAMMVLASLTGIIPQSGPHLLFVTLFAGGSVPFAVLLANSIAQDGHGMLPLLSHSPRTFVLVKAINVLVGLVAGAVVLLIGGLLFQL